MRLKFWILSQDRSEQILISGSHHVANMLPHRRQFIARKGHFNRACDDVKLGGHFQNFLHELRCGLLIQSFLNSRDNLFLLNIHAHRRDNEMAYQASIREDCSDYR